MVYKIKRIATVNGVKKTYIYIDTIIDLTFDLLRGQTTPVTVAKETPLIKPSLTNVPKDSLIL